MLSFSSTLANATNVVSEAHISHAVDSAMDKAVAKSKIAPPGVSIRNGPIVDDAMEVDEPATNGNSKRKARSSLSKVVKYKDDSEDSDDAVPLVRSHFLVMRNAECDLVFFSCFAHLLTLLLGQTPEDGDEEQDL